MEADSWDMISDDRQSDVRDRWMRESYNEYHDSEDESWRDNGEALAQAKVDLAEHFEIFHTNTTAVPSHNLYAVGALNDVRDEMDIPYTNDQLFAALSVEYNNDNYDGRNDPEFSFDDDKLREPSDAPPPEQLQLPGIESVDLATHLTDEMRTNITDALTTAFNKQADSDADDIDPPDYLAESVTDYQDQSWSDMEDSQRLRYAIDYDMANIDLPDEEQDQSELDVSATQADPLREAIASADPKSIWKVSDLPGGKELLLNSSWIGKLNLKDPASMARFKEYVGRVKNAA